MRFMVRLCPLLAAIIIIAANLLGCDGGKISTLGEISGPGSMDEYSWGEYYIHLDQGTGVDLQWFCEPGDAGRFEDGDLPKTRFRVGEVFSDTPVKISVLVTTDQLGAVVKSKYVTLKDVTPLSITEIDGPDSLEENSSASYGVTVTNDTGITYQWSCIPPDAGQFSHPTLAVTDFTAGEVHSVTSIDLFVVINSDHNEPVTRSKRITIIDIPLLFVGEIEGPDSLEEKSSGIFSVSASGDTGITYRWQRIPSDVGEFNDPASASTEFTAGIIFDNTEVEIRVIVSSDHCDQVLRSRNISVVDTFSLLVGEIEGPDPLEESSCGAYSITATGDTGITYNWMCFPWEMGQFNPVNESVTQFSVGPVPQDTYVVLYVSVHSDNDLPVVKNRQIAVVDKGNHSWVQTWGGVLLEEARGVAMDDFGNIFVTGRFYGTVDFDPGEGVDKHTSNWGSDVFLSKFDSAGSFQWARTWGGVELDNGNAVAVDDSGNVYVTGVFYGIADFDPGPDLYELTPVGGSDIFISKFDADGNFQWVRTWGGVDGDWGNGIVVDGLGSVYVTGSFLKTVDFDPGPGSDIHTSNGVWDGFLSKFSPNGDFQWARTWGGSHSEDGRAVAADGYDNVYVTGDFSDTTDLDPGPSVDQHISSGTDDVFLSCFNTSGDFLWGRTWGGQEGDVGYGVAADGMGNSYVTGRFWDAVDFDPGPGTEELISNGDFDVFLSKFDVNGDFQWARTWGGEIRDWGYSTAVDGSGASHVTGYFKGSVDFDPGPATDQHVSHGDHDVFLSRFDTDGNLLWARTWGGNDYDIGTSVATDSYGSSCVTGLFYGLVDFNPGTGIFNLTSYGSSDVFLIKFPPDGDW